MLQIENECPFVPAMALFANESGVETLYAVVKATFDIRRDIALAGEQVPPVLADEYWGDPDSSSLKYAADMQLAKASTDVAVVGQAWAPGDRPTEQIDVRVAVAEREQTLRVFGNRNWCNGAISSPEPFTRMPVVYEYAFGGTYQDDDRLVWEERNPVGRGLHADRAAEALEGSALPNIEDPRCLTQDVGDQAQPAGLGFIAPSWLSRRQFAGTYDDAWQAQRAPYLPVDFDKRFLNCAHPDWIFDRYLQGGEPVELDNLSGRGPLRFELPICRLQADVAIAGKMHLAPLNLDTVLIEPESDRLCMTWRTSVPCDKKALKIESVKIRLLGMNVRGKPGA